MNLVIVVLMLHPLGTFYRLAEVPLPAGSAIAGCQSAAARYNAMVAAEAATGYTAMAATCVVRGKS